MPILQRTELRTKVGVRDVSNPSGSMTRRPCVVPFFADRCVVVFAVDIRLGWIQAIYAVDWLGQHYYSAFPAANTVWESCGQQYGAGVLLHSCGALREQGGENGIQVRSSLAQLHLAERLQEGAEVQVHEVAALPRPRPAPRLLRQLRGLRGALLRHALRQDQLDRRHRHLAAEGVLEVLQPAALRARPHFGRASGQSEAAVSAAAAICVPGIYSVSVAGGWGAGPPSEVHCEAGQGEEGEGGEHPEVGAEPRRGCRAARGVGVARQPERGERGVELALDPEVQQLVREERGQQGGGGEDDREPEGLVAQSEPVEGHDEVARCEGHQQDRRVVLLLVEELAHGHAVLVVLQRGHLRGGQDRGLCSHGVGGHSKQHCEGLRSRAYGSDHKPARIPQAYIHPRHAGLHRKAQPEVRADSTGSEQSTGSIIYAQP
ncbi:hypothetical protein SS50377_20716 [Spironucleus salmonicida]|uniref:Uncharacterized protein n=1 Tax=Spironucleus salmonicida TaxID=348837 RepID=A0A9P8LZC3_9EUKA|nr:hypothetical protein SS50377_20716 [Spironucleus salmonicida]